MSMKKAFLLFVLFFVVFVLIKLPVALILDRVTLPNGIAYEKISGTIWQGKIKRLQIQDEVLHKVEWQTSPLALLMGEVAVQFKFGNVRNTQQISGKGNATYSLSGISLEKTVVRLPADNLKKYSPIPINDIGGRVILDVNSYQFSNALCDVLDGELIWTKSEVDIGGPITFGSIAANLTCDEHVVVATFNGNDQLGLEGEARIASPNQFGFDGFVKPDATLPSAVHNAVGMFGKPDSKGRVKIKL